MKLLRKRLTPLFYGLALCLPLGLKLGVPVIIVQGERLGLFADRSGVDTSGSDYTVDEVHGFLLTAHQPGQPPVQFRLVGLAESDERWQREATGILSMLLEASRNQVKVTLLDSDPAAALPIALVQLPTGTYIQDIVLSDGVAKLDSATLGQMPRAAAAALQQAQAFAQGQHKNIWAKTTLSSGHHDSDPYV
ncbi:hypothetical protein [Nodosilinea nodulosa]|uniref:hypothetical protein n=1 Tax=Nodosilinea nodulosa TaxID=416001 RepID=UPI00037D74B2|nr:hypothetical protein [Nodosilinea nodulosa]